MKFIDIIHGEVEITEPKVLEIIQHPAMQRIKQIWISAYGYLFEQKRNSTRYEHSLGVYLLLKKFQASEEEQIAGLIHDVAHTAFSHLSTYALQGKYEKKELHDLIQDKFMAESGLSDLLEKLGYKAQQLTAKENFPLLENELPDICADRIDYTIRDGLHLQLLSMQEAKLILAGLTVEDNEFVFTNVEAAFKYAFTLFLLNKQYYGSATEAHFNNDFGGLVKLAMHKGVLQETDWFSNDVDVIKKLQDSNDAEITEWLGKYNRNLVMYEDSEQHDFVFPKKIRVVDPKVKVGNEFKRLTQVDDLYARMIEEYVQTHQSHELAVRVYHKGY
jgi:uncharacterized protein